ncbi:electron transfer flavoprotein subunit beta/FixA family protein [bacterium]|nr:electron transfer flavoprotein subunit beta/FixA family protein [bacterium]
MRYITCIKQVPNTTDVRINPETNTLVREGVESVVNPFDMYAIELALSLREKFGGEVIGISMGPPQAEEALREAISVGVDRAYLVTDKSFAGADTLATSRTLVTAIRYIGGADVILVGKQAIDGDTAQVGPGIAESMNIGQVTFVRDVTEIGDGTLRVLRITDKGRSEVEAELPVLLSVTKLDREPRLPSLRGKLRAKKEKIEHLDAKVLNLPEGSVGLAGSPTQVIRIFTPQKHTQGEIKRGKPDELGSWLVEKLRGVL